MYDIIVIGSGYGGAVTAARLAPHVERLLVVERGRRWRTGEFPVTLRDLASAYITRNNPTGLWAFRFGEGTGNAFASSFGGASTVNYGITAQPEPHVFDDPRWPVDAAELAPWFERARAVLKPSPNPRADALGDKAFLDHVEPGTRVDIENTIDWEHCTDCGRCVPGCNVPGAKCSLDTSYLAMALEAGAEARVETTVLDIVPEGLSEGRRGGRIDGPSDPGSDRASDRSRPSWRVRVRPTGRRDDSADEWLPARRVIISAGTFGTLDLLRHNRAHLRPTSMLGQGMSMNGDGLAFLYNTPHALDSHSGAPISTSARLHMVDDEGKRRTLMVMSGRIPMAAMRFSGLALAGLSGVLGEGRQRDAREPISTRLKRRLEDVVSIGGLTETGALAHSFMYKLDGQDSTQGTASFDAAGRSAIDWPGYTDDPIMRFAAKRLRIWAEKMGGGVIPNLATLPGMRAFGVHQLGGCRMAEGPEHGVTDDVGRIFRPDGSRLPNIRIIDGSVLPTSLGVPPSFTIAALAERAAADLVREVAGDA